MSVALYVLILSAGEAAEMSQSQKAHEAQHENLQNTRVSKLPGALVGSSEKF